VKHWDWFPQANCHDPRQFWRLVTLLQRAGQLLSSHHHFNCNMSVSYAAICAMQRSVTLMNMHIRDWFKRTPDVEKHVFATRLMALSSR
jgi:hypothetical protein